MIKNTKRRQILRRVTRSRKTILRRIGRSKKIYYEKKEGIEGESKGNEDEQD
jgi:hypothetical protein